MKDRIVKMNQMYNLPVSDTPHSPTINNLQNFKSILLDEIKEIDEIMSLPPGIARIVAIADLLADLQVYCQSEAVKFGIPNDEVMHIVMDSKESKLGADGKPIKDARGKFLKGPNYWKPEPKIKQLLLELK